MWLPAANAALPLLGDLNGDGAVTVLDLARLQLHVDRTSPLTEELQLLADINQDGLVNEQDVTAIADIILGLRALQELPPPAILATSPGFGEGNVSLNRESIFRFTQPLAATNVITTNTLYAEFGGRRILSRVELGSDRRSMTLFYLEPLPASARLRVTINGEELAGLLGTKLDVNGDGTAGGVGFLEFDTASISPVPGTAVIGWVFASELVPDPDNLTNSLNVPLAGVTITVDGAEQTLRAVTDSNGVFVLTPCPAGRFFVHVDGRTVTNLAAGIRYPDLAYYPFVGKAWEAVAGVMTNLAGGNGLIYLPLITQGTLQTISLISNTLFTFPASVIASNPALAGVSLSVPAGALYNDSGQRGGQVGIAPVAPDRLPEPLPPGLNLPLVITVQTDGGQNFSEPVPICFPNSPDPNTGVALPPGAKTALWSFNHDTGRWEMQGPMTVSADGLMACTDPGVGIRQPGWHGSFPGTSGEGGENEGDWPPDPNPNEKGQQPPASPTAPDPGGDTCPSVDPKSSRLPPPPPIPGDPVHLFSGEFYHSEEDMRIKGVGLDFVWTRKFQSKRIDRTARMLPFGPRWTHSYAIRLEANYSFNQPPGCPGCGGGSRGFYSGNGAVVGGGVADCTTHRYLRSMSVIDGNGRGDEYFESGGGDYKAKGLFRELRQVDDDTWALTFEDKGKWVFSRLVNYQVVRIEDRHGNHLDFTYENYDPAEPDKFRLRTVTDTLGRPITISYTSLNQIEAVTDFAGRSVRYEYYPSGDPSGIKGSLKAVNSPAVTGTVNGNDYPQGKRRTYTYFLGPRYVADYIPNFCGGYSEFSTSFIGIRTITDGRNNDPGDPRYQHGAFLTNFYATNGSGAGSRYVIGSFASPGWVEVPYLRLIRQTWGGQDLSFSYEQNGPHPLIVEIQPCSYPVDS